MAKDKLSPAGDTVKVVRLGGEMYRVRTHVTVEKIPENEMASMGEAQPQPDGSFELLLSEKDGEKGKEIQPTLCQGRPLARLLSS
jgi:hypothetical protein